MSTYTRSDLPLNRVDNLVDALPLVLVFCAPLDHSEALQYVDDVVDASTLYLQLFRALVQVKQASLWSAIEEQETATEFSETFLLAIVGTTFCTIVICLCICSTIDRLVGVLVCKNRLLRL